MAAVRCYVPLSASHLEALSTDRRVSGPLDAYAVTAAVRSASPAGDDEEWEYVALQEAARSLLDAGAPIIVAAVDVDKSEVTRLDKSVSALVRVGDLELPRIASLQLGDDVVAEAELADTGVAIELSWYDTTELGHVLELGRRAAGPAQASSG